MLPFLKRKESSIASSIVALRKPDGGIEKQPDESYEDGSGLKACARDLIEAVHSKNEEGVAAAIRNAFEILENEEHEESPLE